MGGNVKIGDRLRVLVRAGTIGALVAMTGVVPLATPLGASTYPTLSNSYYSNTGYDASYPQGTSTPPSGLTFAIIGVGHGRPFTTNQYAGTQWKNAITATNATPSLYFNTGYALAYAKSDTANCTLSSAGYTPTGASGHTLSALQAAWAIGCSEADWALSTAPGTPTMWWADIETGNSWSNDVTLNQATILGIVTEMTTIRGKLVGIYSTPSMWSSITGTGFVVPGVTGDWQAGFTCSSSSPGFTLMSTSTYAPLLLAQYSTITVSGTKYDLDMAC